MPIVLCTGYSDRMDEAGAKAMGIRAFLVQPIEKDALAMIVRHALDQH